MEFTGKAMGIVQDFETGAVRITFTVNETAAVRNGYDAIKDMEVLDIRAVKHRNKRSLDANAYAWVLMSRIAEHPAVNTSKDEIYEEMLNRYGILYQDENGYIVITLKADVDISKVDGHWKLIRNNGTYKAYAMIKGSSGYDTKEMSQFIDGIIYEAKQLEIETLTPAELEQMKEAWKP